MAIQKLPPELFPGMDYTAFAFDPDGHAVQLYYYMEQIGWAGHPRLAVQRPRIDNESWTAHVDAASDTFTGKVLLGPFN